MGSHECTAFTIVYSVLAKWPFPTVRPKEKHAAGPRLASKHPCPASMRPEPSHSSQPLCGPNLPLIHSKVVRDFMPERLLDQAFQILAVACYSLVRTLEYGDSVRQMERLNNAAMYQGAPF